MPLEPPNYSPQPFSAYCRFYLGGELITLDGDSRPQYLQSFRFSRKANEIGEFELVIVDPDWDRVQQKILDNYDKAEFSFGYEGGGRQAPGPEDRFKGRVTKATPSFIIDAVELRISGRTEEIVMHGMKKTRSHPDPRFGETPATIDEYVKRILKRSYAEFYDPKYIEPCQELLVHESFWGGARVPMTFQQTRMSDLQFIRNVLAPKATTKTEPHVAAYVFYFDPHERKFHFRPPEFHKPPSRTFMFMRDQMSEIISFSVESNGAVAFAAKGGERVAVPYVDLMTREQKYVHVDNKTTANKPRLTDYKQRLTGYPLTTDNHPFVTTIPTQNEDVALAVAADRYFRGFWTNVKATLVIQGDYSPDIFPKQVIEMCVLTPSGDIHNTSGRYWINGVTDEITPGGWTTTLDLIREGSPEGGSGGSTENVL